MKQINVKSLVLLALLAALLVVMSFTPLGYLRVGIVSITFNIIPVAIGAAALGPRGGAILGAVFGLTSFVQCFTGDPFGAYLLALNPFFTFVVCVVSRILVGVIAGFADMGFAKLLKNNPLRYSLTGIVSALSNTVLFIFFMITLFGKSQINAAAGGVLDESLNVIQFFAAFATVNAVWEALASFILTGAVCTALYKAGLLNGFRQKAAA